MPHSQININPNLGAWYQKDIKEEIIIESVRKKERKIAAYKASGIEKQWLLIVIGSAGESSYEVEGKIEIELKTDFDKVFILEDFKNKLYEPK